MNAINPVNMTTAEKISGMEVLWDSLRTSGNISSPDWHKDVLLSREEKIHNKQIDIIDWEIAKKNIYNNI
jgi:hypothetical protein